MVGGREGLREERDEKGYLCMHELPIQPVYNSCVYFLWKTEKNGFHRVLSPGSSLTLNAFTASFLKAAGYHVANF